MAAFVNERIGYVADLTISHNVEDGILRRNLHAQLGERRSVLISMPYQLQWSARLFWVVLSSVPLTAAPTSTTILGQPTDRSITLATRSDTTVEAYYEYGFKSGAVTARTTSIAIPVDPSAGGFFAGQALFADLQPEARYFFRLQYRAVGSGATYAPGSEGAFRTQRPAGSTFVFGVQGDSHPGRPNTMFNAGLYTQTLKAMAAEQPDSDVINGDDFSVDTLPIPFTKAAVTGRYTRQLSYFNALGVPLFPGAGNHEETALRNYNLPTDRTNRNEVPIWAQNARNLYYPSPVPNDSNSSSFYTCNLTQIPGIGILPNYYAGQWGDANGVTYQSLPNRADNTYTAFSADAYRIGDIFPLGSTKVTAGPTAVGLAYVRQWLPADERPPDQVSGKVQVSYAIQAAGGAVPTINTVRSSGGGEAISPNSWVEIKGSNLSAGTTSRTWQGSDFVGGQMPTQLDGVSATINGKAAYVYYISPNQLNVLAPSDAMGGPVAVQVSVNGATGEPFTATAQTRAPSFFSFDDAGHVAATHADGSLLGPVALYPGSSTPAQPGETIIVYGNGFGATSTPVMPGSPQQNGVLSPAPDFTIGGAAAQVQFAGLVFPGEYQFNLVVPNNTPSGDQPIVATLGGRTTQAGAVLSVQAPETGGGGTFSLTSAAGANGAAMSADYTCDGTGSTLPLAWSNAPAGTKEFALLMTTLPGDGTTKWNWVLYNIPPKTASLAKDSFLVGTLGVGSDGPGTVYNAPCSQGPGAKVYTYTLYALSAAPIFPIPADQVNGQMVTNAIVGITLSKATFNLSATRATAPTGASAACNTIRSSTRASKSGTASVSCDSTYAYVGSNGITTNTMMNGITATNLQIPIPTNFNGANAWKIPLNPVVAAAPTNVVDGPLGVAINGVPIFNPCKQGGCSGPGGGDTKALGELDICNGHAGRADDYHYHAAPACMMADQPPGYWDTHPLGWALDGFAIFGFNDADGSVAVRDSGCGGNTKTMPNAPAGYSYHLTNAAPYVTNCLAGTPSPDLANQGFKYRPFRQPPVTPFNVSGMTLTTGADGFQVLQFSSAINFTTTENGTDRYSNAPGTYKIRYKQVTGEALTAVLATQRPNTNFTACWEFQFLNGGSTVSQPTVSYCK